MREVVMMELALMVLVWVTFARIQNSNLNLTTASKEETTTLFDQSVELVEELQVQAMALSVERLLAIPVAVNPHPLSQLRVHGFDDILNH